MTLNTRGIQGESLSAALDRLANTVYREGVIDITKNSGSGFSDIGSYAVNEQPSPGLSVRVGSGVSNDLAVVEGDLSGQGNFIVQNDETTTTLAISAGDAVDDRYDLIVLSVEDDTFDSSGNDQAVLEVIQGTPGETHQQSIENNLPDTALLLAVVEMIANETQVEDSQITDYRYEAPIRGQLYKTLYIEQADSPYTFTKADPLAVGNGFTTDWLHHVVAKVQAAGGGGGGSQATSVNEASAGDGGGGGGYAEGKVHVGDLGTTETVTIGEGGAAGSGSGGAPGTDGDDSSFGTHVVATGGKGGNFTGSGEGDFVGSTGLVAGGVGTAGDLLLPGGPGGGRGRFTGDAGARGHGGAGGSSQLGAGGPDLNSSTLSQAGLDATGFGGGGGGGCGGSNVAAAAGAPGTDGIVIIELYA